MGFNRKRLLLWTGPPPRTNLVLQMLVLHQKSDYLSQIPQLSFSGPGDSSLGAGDDYPIGSVLMRWLVIYGVFRHDLLPIAVNEYLLRRFLLLKIQHVIFYNSKGPPFPFLLHLQFFNDLLQTSSFKVLADT